MKVLIVEDDLTTGHLMKYVVGRHADFTHAIDGEEAFDAFCDAFESGEPFDLVFLDLMLPIVDGQEVLQAIRQFEEQNGIIHTEGVPVVVTTSLEDNSEVHQAMAAGALDYLMKPVKTEKLLDIIKRVERQTMAARSLEDGVLNTISAGGNPSELKAEETCDEC
jgi:two-component system chemotaxis response regulator CheY